MRVITTANVLLYIALPVHAESWVKFSSTSMKFPSDGKVINGYSESFYDTDSLRYYGSTRVEIRLKHVTYIGDIVPNTGNELLRIDCLTNRFESLIASPDDPGVLMEINKGDIGRDSAYRIIAETYCGIPGPRR